MIDNVAAACAATAHIWRLGRRRIATMGVREGSTGETARRRVRGYAEALAEAGRVLQPHLLAPVMSFHRADGARAKRQLLALDHRPDAVFCFNDLLTLGALRALHNRRG